MSKEGHTPTDAEMADAETHLTPAQARATEYRNSMSPLETYKTLNDVFEEQGVSPEARMNIDIIDVDSPEYASRYAVDNARLFKGLIDGQKISIVSCGNPFEPDYLEGTIEGLELGIENGLQILKKYKPVAVALKKYNANLNAYRESIKEENDKFTDQQKVNALLKNIL